jgi:hypothetical protein
MAYSLPSCAERPARTAITIRCAGRLPDGRHGGFPTGGLAIALEPNDLRHSGFGLALLWSWPSRVNRRSPSRVNRRGPCHAYLSSRPSPVHGFRPSSRGSGDVFVTWRADRDQVVEVIGTACGHFDHVMHLGRYPRAAWSHYAAHSTITLEDLGAYAFIEATGPRPACGSRSGRGPHLRVFGAVGCPPA